MSATVDLGEVTTRPKASIRVLGLHIDGKLRWGPHVKEMRSKLATQCLALSKTAGSTWGASLNKARQVYSAVIQPAITYAAASWHTPRGLRETRQSHAKQLGVIQNTCLRQITGSYRATNVKVLEAEAGVPPLQIALDQAVLRSQALRGIHPLTKQSNAHIRRRLRPKRGRRREVLKIPAEEKEQWSLRSSRLNNWADTLTPGGPGRDRLPRPLKKAITQSKSGKTQHGRIYGFVIKSPSLKDEEPPLENVTCGPAEDLFIRASRKLRAPPSRN